MKNTFFIFILLFLFSIKSNSQNNNQFVIVTIEKERNKGQHKNEVDYWLVLRDVWNDISEKAIIPFYLEGFSATDYNECCIDESLILFNFTSEESFSFESNFISDQNKLIEIIKDKRKKIQTVRKKWSSGLKEKISIYLTPINGEFCICSLEHKDDNSKIGYEGQIAIPLANFSYDYNFWESKESKGIMQTDYSELPFLSLQTIQWK